MKLFKTVSCALAALAITSGVWAQTDAPTPAQIAQACITHMTQRTEATVGAIQERTLQGVHRLHYLASYGAPEAVLIASARVSRHKINAAAAAGARIVNQLAHGCLVALHELGAPDELIQAVRDAREYALGVIGTARERGISIIADALNAALANAGGVGLA